MNPVTGIVLTCCMSLMMTWAIPINIFLTVDDDSLVRDEVMKLYVDMYKYRMNIVDGKSPTGSLKDFEHKGTIVTKIYIDNRYLFKNYSENNFIYKIPACNYDFTKITINPDEVYKVTYFTLSKPTYYLGFDLNKVDKNFRIALLPLFGISKVIGSKSSENRDKAIEFIKNCKIELTEYKQRFPDCAVGAIENIIQILGICAEMGCDNFFSRILNDAPKPGQRIIVIDIDSSNCIALLDKYTEYRYDDGNTIIYTYGSDVEYSKRFTKFMEKQYSTKCSPLSVGVKHRDTSLFFQALRAVIIECDLTGKVTVDLLRRKLDSVR